MYRVVTKTMLTQHKVRKLQIDLGPWQPREETARSWARYLESTGLYDSVELQSNGRAQSSQSEDFPYDALTI